MTTSPKDRVDVDTGRARRALALDVQEIEDGAYLVTGGAEPHVVQGRECDCTDAQFHPGPCKHRLSVYLNQRLDPRVLEALRRAIEGDDCV